MADAYLWLAALTAAVDIRGFGRIFRNYRFSSELNYLESLSIELGSIARPLCIRTMNRWNPSPPVVAHSARSESLGIPGEAVRASDSGSLTISSSGFRAERLNRGIRINPARLTTGGLMVLRGIARVEAEDVSGLAS